MARSALWARAGAASTRLDAAATANASRKRTPDLAVALALSSVRKCSNPSHANSPVRPNPLRDHNDYTPARLSDRKKLPPGDRAFARARDRPGHRGERPRPPRLAALLLRRPRATLITDPNRRSCCN